MRAVMGKGALMADDPAHRHAQMGPGDAGGHARRLAGRRRRTTIAKGQEIVDIETSKIANAFESPVAGTLRRRLVGEGETLPVGALLASSPSTSVADAEIDAFVAEFQASFAASWRRRPTAAGARARRPSTSAAAGIRYLRAGRGGRRRRSSSSTASAATSTTGCSTSRPLAETAHDLRARPAGPWRLDQGGRRGRRRRADRGRARLHGGARHRQGASRRPFAGRRDRLDLALNHPERVASVTLIAPAGLGPEITMDYIDGFIATSRARKLKPVLEMLVATRRWSPATWSRTC